MRCCSAQNDTGENVVEPVGRCVASGSTKGMSDMLPPVDSASFLGTFYREYRVAVYFFGRFVNRPYGEGRIWSFETFSASRTVWGRGLLSFKEKEI
ncbi:MAG: hypothetical protein J6Q78_04190 [Clostridia bacterium]|nr:hypothetical protein [Clostridia bacterium]